MIDAVFSIGVIHGSRAATLARVCSRPGRPGLAPSRSGRSADTQGLSDLSKADGGLVEPPTPAGPASGLCPAKVKQSVRRSGRKPHPAKAQTETRAIQRGYVAGKCSSLAAGTGHKSGKSEARTEFEDAAAPSRWILAEAVAAIGHSHDFP